MSRPGSSLEGWSSKLSVFITETQVENGVKQDKIETKEPL